MTIPANQRTSYLKQCQSLTTPPLVSSQVMSEKIWWIFMDRKSSQVAAGSSVWRPELFQMTKGKSERAENAGAGPAKEALRKKEKCD